MLALSRSDLRAAVPMSEAVRLMKVAFTELSAGRAASPLRAVVPLRNDRSLLITMPGYVAAERAASVKIVSFFGDNVERGLPTIHALVYAIDDETGVPLGIMEGGYVTALRTGAVSGAATDLLAREDSRILTVIGTGVQGVTQAAAVCAVRPIERILAVDIRPEALERYRQMVAQDWPDLADRVETTSDVSSAVQQADVICCATTARDPVFDDTSVRPGTHINAVGAFTPEMQEVPPETVKRARVVVDELSAVLAEGGDIIKPLNDGLIDQRHVEDELGHVAAGERPGRTSPEQVTFFKSVGNAVQDAVVARRAIDEARRLGLGVELDLMR
jgi:ornithine cyclodeaminase